MTGRVKHDPSRQYMLPINLILRRAEAEPRRVEGTRAESRRSRVEARVPVHVSAFRPRLDGVPDRPRLGLPASTRPVWSDGYQMTRLVVSGNTLYILLGGRRQGYSRLAQN